MLAQLGEIGISAGDVHRNLPAAELTARALARGEGILAANGALVVKTGARTGRSPADRFIVDEPEAEAVAWSDVNQRCSPELFDAAAQEGERVPSRPGRVRLRWVRGRGPRASAAHPRCGRRRLARPFRAHACSSGRNLSTRGLPARVHGRQLRGLPHGSRRRRDPLRRVRRHLVPPPDRADPRHHVRRGDQEGSVHGHELPAARSAVSCRCTAPRTSAARATSPSTSACRGRARPPSPPTRAAVSSATTSTAGPTTGSSTSRAAATPR